MQQTILICDDEKSKLEELSQALESFGYKIESVTNGDKLIEQLKISSNYAAIFLDLIMPDHDGLSILLKLDKKNLPPIIATAPLRAEELLGTALNAGAKDLITYPLEVRRLKYSLETQIQKYNLQQEISDLKQGTLNFSNAFHAKHFTLAKKQLEKQALTPLPLLIEAPKGTLKNEVIAKIISLSERHEKKNLTLDCRALKLTEQEIEIALASSKFGFIIFDHIDALTATMQEVLKTLLKTHLGIKSTKYQARIIATSVPCLFDKVKLKTFNDELFYSLSLQRLVLPTLEDRKDTISAIAHSYLKTILTTEEKPITRISDEAIALLATQNFQNNDKSLYQALYKAVMICDETTLTPLHFNLKSPKKAVSAPTLFPDFTPFESDGLALTENGEFRDFASIEEDIYRQAFRAFEGNISQMARQLKVGRSTLYRKLTEYGLLKDESQAKAA